MKDFHLDELTARARFPPTAASDTGSDFGRQIINRKMLRLSA
jgi:hypothetical protein